MSTAADLRMHLTELDLEIAQQQVVLDALRKKRRRIQRELDSIAVYITKSGKCLPNHIWHCKAHKSHKPCKAISKILKALHYVAGFYEYTKSHCTHEKSTKNIAFDINTTTRARAVDEPRNEHTQGPERNEEHEEGDTIWGALVGTGAGGRRNRRELDGAQLGCGARGGGGRS
ncbi:hypothetical protein B0H10DRAFT_1970608 [Mycena sp. CBHHK59/15]|nr:hypothetical protein B0H10DRAFT_1970608 [Mycena sp. CBHHK59/15]